MSRAAAAAAAGEEEEASHCHGTTQITDAHGAYLQEAEANCR